MDPADVWPAGTACEFRWEDRWYRAVSDGLASAVQEEGEGAKPCLNLIEVRSKGVVCHLPINEVCDSVVAKGTHLSWSAADEKKIGKAADSKRTEAEEEETPPPPKKPKQAAPARPKQAAHPKPKKATPRPPEEEAAAAEPAASGGRPRRASAQFSVKAMLKSVEADDLGSMDGLSSEDAGSDYEGEARRPSASRAAPKRKRAPSKKAAVAHSDYEEDGDEAGSDDDEADSDEEPRRKKGSKAKAKAKGSDDQRKSGGKARAAPPRDDGTWVGPKPKPAPAPKESAARNIKNPPAQGAQPFVDAAGLDIEDRGVEWIVEHQCEKLLPLLRDALSHGELDLSMATACSGTDAPVVAMRVAREALRRHGVDFAFEHVMSCEIEPYKQSFIARNNPGVLLFPDVAQLGATPRGKQATTAYGSVAHVPPAKMIVAGTSCKDFSNLKGKHRKSIEDMGTSGETFIGFVNLLFEQRYPVGILENLKSAEWEKSAPLLPPARAAVPHQEDHALPPVLRTVSYYITGELPLGSVGEPSGAHELRFQVEGNAFVVCEVSESAGAKLGAKLLGYRCSDGGKVTPITPASFRGTTVGLASLRERFGLEDGHTLIFDVPVKYKTTLAYLDGKEFGVPQTRQRKYMLIWQPDHFGEGVDVELLWHTLVQHLRCPLKYNIDSFLLSDENDRIHRFRDALRGPLGRLTSISRQGGDWWTSASRDAQHNRTYRQAKGPKSTNMLQTPAELEARPFTNWKPQGEFKLASERWWPELMAVLSQRQLDLADCFGIKAAEAGLDLLHHSLWWNISQNVGRTDVIPRPGLTGCITPGGELFGPHVGRCILGYEKLLLSGIPADKLLLGTESEVQLSDLAGNAMVMPVVSAAILAVLCLPAYARRLEADPRFGLDQLSKEANATETKKTKDAKRSKEAKGKASKGESSTAATKGPDAGADELLDRLRALLPLCSDAEATSVLCTCETSGGISKSSIVQCKDCLLTLCRSCGANRDLGTHEGGTPCAHACCASKGVIGRLQAKAPAQFEHTLRRKAPTTIVLEQAEAAQLAALGEELPPGVHDSAFRLTRVLRERGAWALCYSVCDADMGTPLAELRVTIGQVGAARGVQALLYSFAPALQGGRGKMPPVARLLLPAATTGAAAASTGPRWEMCREARKCRVELTALSTTPSFRAEVGLVNYKAELWPSELHIAGDASVEGVYERTPCRFSAVFGALWKRKAQPGAPPLWLLVSPTVDRTGPDVLVVCTSPCYRDGDAHVVLEIVPELGGSGGAAKKGRAGGGQDARVGNTGEHERPFDLLCRLGKASGKGGPAAKKKAKTSAGGSGGAAPIAVAARAKVWEPAALRFTVPADPTKVKALEYGCSLSGLPRETAQRLIELTTVEALSGGDAAATSSKQPAASKSKQSFGGDGGWHELRVLTASSTVAERRLAEAVAGPLLAFAAHDGLKSLAEWQSLAAAKGQPAWGECTACAPPRPAEIWSADGERTYDVDASNTFEQALRSRPSAWDVRIKQSGELQVVARPHVAAHRAAEALRRGRPVAGDEVQIRWQVDAQRSELSAAPMTSFDIPNSLSYTAADLQPPFFKEDKRLYERQAKGVGRALAIDDRAVPFKEVEMSDHALSSGIGWTLKVRAERDAPLAGGVIADAVGAGKTVIALALIASRVRAARAAARASAATPQHSGATLVIAPIHSVKPVWHQMIEEFTTGLRHLVIESLDDLQALSVKQVREADVVVVACELLFNRVQKHAEAYQEHLVQKASGEALPSFLVGRSQSRNIGAEPDILCGVWVPNSSQDPFGKSGARQEDRDQAALFSARYAKAVVKLRAKSFKADAKGVPLEWFTWERLIIDECHESLVMDQEDAEARAEVTGVDESKMQREKRKCAQRELLGIGQPDPAKRPIRVRRSTWGLTGTPLLSSETRITELAALCGGTYVCGNAAHWRTMERASVRDVFLRYHESASSLLYLEERTRAAQAYLNAAVQRNRIDGELSHIKRSERTVTCTLPAGSEYEQLLLKHSKSGGCDFNPSHDDFKSDAVWNRLLAAAAGDKVRQAALRGVLDAVHKEEAWTKVIVFAPEGVAFDSAATALRQLKRPVLVGDPNDASSTDAIDKFSRPDICDPNRPLVLLLSFDHSSALNLQYVSHHVVFYAPLWGEDTNGVHAAANEQQAIGRVVRIGQRRDVVVHRLLAVGPKKQPTIEQRVVHRNKSDWVTRQAVIN